MQNTQWMNYMAQLLDIVTLNSESDICQTQILTQETFPSHICNIIIYQCRTGFGYILI